MGYLSISARIKNINIGQYDAKYKIKGKCGLVSFFWFFVLGNHLILLILVEPDHWIYPWP